jgi:hypothetical protein
MNRVLSYTELKNLTLCADGLEEIRQVIQEVSEAISPIVLDFINDVEYTQAEYLTAYRKLTGCMMVLNPIFSYMTTVKRNISLAKFQDIKTTWRPTDAKDKFVATTANNEADLFVADYRELRNMAEGYINAASCGVYTCKQKLSEKIAEFVNTND